MGACNSGGVVLPLVEKGAGLLPGERAVMEAHAVHGEDGLGLLAVEQAVLQRRKLFKLADAGLGALHDPGGRKLFYQFGHHGLFDLVGVGGLGQSLEHQDVVVAVHDEAGEFVGFAENHAVGVGVPDHLSPVFDRVAHSLAHQPGEVFDLGRGKQAQRDLRSCAVEGITQEPATLALDLDQGARSGAFGRNHVGAVDPGMPGPQAGHGACIHHHGRSRVLGHRGCGF